MAAGNVNKKLTLSSSPVSSVESNQVSGNLGPVRNTGIPLLRIKALERSVDKSLAAEDLDNIQVELDTILSNASMRAQVLKTEYDSIDKERNDQRNNNNKQQQILPACGLNSRPQAIAIAGAATVGAADTAAQATTAGADADVSINNQLPKNDMLNNFWLSVEPYCRPLTNDDLRLIDDMLEQYKVPVVSPMPAIKPNGEDDVLNEIKRITAEINDVAHSNSNELKKLRATAAYEMKRTDLKRKLDNVDQDILKCYKCRSNGKNFTIEEQQEIYKLIGEQRSLREQLERM